jgi:Na+-driven multidrug efflux pump
MKPSRLVWIHLLVFAVLIATFLFFSEPLLQWLAPDLHTSEMWLRMVTIGCMFLLLLCAISLAVFLRLARRANSAQQR